MIANLTPAEVELARGLIVTIIEGAGRGPSVPHAFMVTAIADATGLTVTTAAQLLNQTLPNRRPISFSADGVEYRLLRDGSDTVDARAVKPDRYSDDDLFATRELCARLIRTKSDGLSMGYTALADSFEEVTGLPARQVHSLICAALPLRPVGIRSHWSLRRFGFDGVSLRRRTAHTPPEPATALPELRQTPSSASPHGLGGGIGQEGVGGATWLPLTPADIATEPTPQRPAGASWSVV